MECRASTVGDRSRSTTSHSAVASLKPRDSRSTSLDYSSLWQGLTPTVPLVVPDLQEYQGIGATGPREALGDVSARELVASQELGDLRWSEANDGGELVRRGVSKSHHLLHDSSYMGARPVSEVVLLISS